MQTLEILSTCIFIIVSDKESRASGSRSSTDRLYAAWLLGLKFTTLEVTDTSAYVTGVSGHLAGPSSHDFHGNITPKGFLVMIANSISSSCDDLRPDAFVERTGTSHDPPAHMPL